MTDPLYLRAERVIREYWQEMQRALELRNLLAATIEKTRRQRQDYYNTLSELDNIAQVSRMLREQQQAGPR
jgi:hypothetical protein